MQRLEPTRSGCVRDVAARSGGHLLPEFEWDENNEQKLLDRHDVSALEAEQCFANAHTKGRKGDGDHS